MRRKPFLSVCSLAAALAGCAPDKADPEKIGATLSDKTDVAIGDVPDGALAAARALRPDIAFSEAEKEVRNGRTYYDIEGRDQQGAEIELDIIEEGDGWRVVEIQRDVALEQTPAAVRSALAAAAPDFAPARIIESAQGDGVAVIYELYAVAADGREEKLEIKVEGDEVEVLSEEWAH